VAVIVLSRRERQVVNHIARGLGYQKIADRLGLSYETVRTYASRIRKKLKMRSKVQIAIWALKQK
jgi:DNA-binding CsgD family transcriptional regulator